MKSRLVCISFCLALLLAGFFWVSVGVIHELPLQAIAAIKYRLGTGDEVDFTAITKTNQGQGSGLDADKLDGKNSTDFLQSSSSASNTFDLGDGQSTDKIYKFNIGGTNLPGVRYNVQTGKVQVSHDGTSWTDIGQSTLNVKKNDASVSGNASTIDFSSKFNVTESPTGEANIDIASGGVSSTEIQDGTVANVDVATNAAIAESKLSLNFATHSNANDPTAGEKAALAGTSGTPSGTNKYVTDADVRNTDARIPTAHKTTHASGGSDVLTPADMGAEATANKNAANGYPGLDATSKLTGSQQVYGTAANTACQGNDSRLSDARTPTAHASTHAPGGTDALSTAVASSQALGDTASEGTATSFARSDHKHALTSYSSRVRARRITTAQSISNATWTDVIFNSEDWDGLNEFNTTTGIFTAQVAGKYQFFGSVTFNANGVGIRRVATPNSEVSNTPHGSYWASLSFVNEVSLLAGETIKIQVFQDSGGALDLVANLCLLVVRRVE